MNVQQLLYQIFPLLNSIRDDKEKLTKLLDFMKEEIPPDDDDEIFGYVTGEDIVNEQEQDEQDEDDDDEEDDENEDNEIYEKENLPEKYQNIVKLIADNLSENCITYFNPDTLELEDLPKAMLSEIGYSKDDEKEISKRVKELFGFKLVHIKWKKCVTIEPLDSHDSFEIMESFVNQLKDRREATKLTQAITGRKPFANFNHLIHESDYRNEWFAFRLKNLEKYVIRHYFSEYLKK